MGWFFSSSPAVEAPAQTDIAPLTNLASDLKPPSEAAQKVKPCCVCTNEKSARDECMLFSKSDDPQDDCKGLVTQYKDCMKGYGFKV